MKQVIRKAIHLTKRAVKAVLEGTTRLFRFPMPEAVKNSINSLAVHKLTVFWVVFFTFNALAASTLGALTGVEWATLTTQQKVLIGLAIFISWSNTMMAFANQAITRLRKGQDVVPDTNGTNPPIPIVNK